VQLLNYIKDIFLPVFPLVVDIIQRVRPLH